MKGLFKISSLHRSLEDKGSFQTQRNLNLIAFYKKKRTRSGGRQGNGEGGGGGWLSNSCINSSVTGIVGQTMYFDYFCWVFGYFCAVLCMFG